MKLKLLRTLANLLRLPFRLQVLVGAGALTVAGLGGYAAFVLPQQRQIHAFKIQLALQGTEPLAARESVPPITNEERNLWVQLEARLRERFPPEKDLPDALRGVAELARSAGMELVALNLHTPAPRPPGAAAAPTPAVSPVASRVPPPLAPSPTTIKLSALHRYRDLVRFLDGLPHLPVLVIVESLETTRVENALSTEMTLRTLRWGSSDGTTGR